MRKILKFLKPHAASVVAIIAVLVLQAYCDLSLPAYTSDIVNVGIQQGGIDEHIPDKIAKEDMENLFLFMPKKDVETVKKAYKTDKDTYDKEAYVLRETDDTEKLEKILNKPMLMSADMEADTSGKGMSLEQMKMLPEEQRMAMLQQMNEQMKEMPDAMLEQASTIYIKAAYENLGVDTDKIQSNYILTTGGKMLALAFLGMLVSVMVGLLASRVAATTGRDLRSGIFKKVVGFSSAEFDKFSTASLITRSTNDIQQIQLVIVMLLRMVLYAPIIGIGGVVKVLNTNVSMSWIIALAVIMISLLVFTLFIVAMPKFKMLQNLVDKLNLVTREILTGLPVIRAFSTEKHEEERFDKANRDLTRTNLFVNRAMTLMMPFLSYG